MTTITPAAVRVFPLSIFGPVHLGIDENGDQVTVDLAERNMLLGGEPGGGKSNALNLITAHGALSADCKLILIDGKQVELGPWRHCADIFIGPSISAALDAMTRLQQIMNTRYDKLLAAGLRKITPKTGEPVYLVVIDEYAYFSATVGDRKQQAEFAALTRDLVARGRAAGVIVILATQRPSHQVIDPSLRDCSATGGPSAAPPTQAQTPSSATAGHPRATPPPASTPSRSRRRSSSTRTAATASPSASS